MRKYQKVLLIVLIVFAILILTILILFGISVINGKPFSSLFSFLSFGACKNIFDDGYNLQLYGGCLNSSRGEEYYDSCVGNLITEWYCAGLFNAGCKNKILDCRKVTKGEGTCVFGTCR